MLSQYVTHLEAILQNEIISRYMSSLNRCVCESDQLRNNTPGFLPRAVKPLAACDGSVWMTLDRKAPLPFILQNPSTKELLLPVAHWLPGDTSLYSISSPLDCIHFESGFLERLPATFCAHAGARRTRRKPQLAHRLQRIYGSLETPNNYLICR